MEFLYLNKRLKIWRACVSLVLWECLCRRILSVPSPNVSLKEAGKTVKFLSQEIISQPCKQ